MAKIIIKHLYKRYGRDKYAVINDFNLEIEHKEFIVFVGPSGCGKTTTLRMIAGLEDVTEGEIYIGDTLVNHLPPKDRDIAMVFQNYALYPNMSVYENIAFGLRLRKMPKHQIDLAVKRSARILEIEPFLERKPKQLSGGQRQRVALGRAIVRNPQVFLMDEPLSNLDAKLRTQMRTEIIKLHKSLGTTIVYVTHDQIEAMTMGDRIVVMKDGVIQQADTPENIYSNPDNTFVASFIGSPPMNFISGRIRENNYGKLEFHTTRFAVDIPGFSASILRNSNMINRTVTLGIRPENIYPDSFDPDNFNPGNIKSGNIEFEDSTARNIGITGIFKHSELMGAFRYLHLDIGQEQLLVVRTSPHYKRIEDDSVKLFLDMSKALFFHSDTGERFKG